PEAGGKPDKLPIPDSQKAQAELLHNELVESIAENDETLLDLYLEQGELTESQMRDGLQTSLLKRDLFPVFCNCAARNMGTGRVMGFLGNIAPNPLEANQPLDNEGKKLELKEDGEAIMFTFKNSAASHVGDLLYFKVYGNVIKPGITLINHATGDAERISNLYITNGEKRTEVNAVRTGD